MWCLDSKSLQLEQLILACEKKPYLDVTLMFPTVQQLWNQITKHPSLENVISKLQHGIFPKLSRQPHSSRSLRLVLCLFFSHHLHSCWRTSQTSCDPTSPCTLTRRSWNCRCLPPLVVAACDPCLCTLRPPSAPLGSTSSDRETHSRPYSLSAPGLWRCWRKAWCWPSWVRYSKKKNQFSLLL